uniref:Ribosomal protein S20 n=1 Tax=Nitophyllum punctatum TaxID=158729 RepID=A0A4D6WVL2_9FLOR|nr:ribosomal protein S20 [Nitophyllum punctatum]
MPKNLSSIKRISITSRNRLRNKKYKLAIKKSIKKYLFSVKSVDSTKISNLENLDNLSFIYQKIDKAIKRGVIHKNKGARKKARLAKYMLTRAN